MGMQWIQDPERVRELRAQGLIVDCSMCQNGIDKKADKQIAFCGVLRRMVGTGIPRICDHFKERTR